MTSLRILSAGAAKGVVDALAGGFEQASGVKVDATFDAAGAIASAASGGEFDLVILPAQMLDTLASQGLVDDRSIAALGRVPTGIAVPEGQSLPDVRDADALKASLDGAAYLYCPDTARSTAGVHFSGVLRTLGLYERSLEKLRTYPNGAKAMAALAAERRRPAIGCTQITEILYTPGVVLVAPLPEPFELATIYAVAVSSRKPEQDEARSFAARLTGADTRALRIAGGFLDRSP